MSEKPIKVLIVDDEKSITQNMSKYFTEVYIGEFDVIATNDSLQVIPMLEENQDTQVIISDYQMPNLNGFELLLKIKKKFPTIFFIMMTGFGTAELRDNARQSGAVQYVEKPFNIPDIAGMIRELVDSQSAGFTGFIDELEFVEIVQFLSISSSDMQLEIETKDNKGTLDFRGGELVHAETSDKQGAEAFYDIFLWKGGQFNPNKLPADLEQTIFEPVEGLLLEAARLEDEKSVMLETEEKIDDVEELPADEAMSAELVEKPDLEVKPEISSDTPATSTSAAPVKRKKKDGSDQKIISIENVTEIVSPIVDSFMQYFPKNKDKITYNKLPLQKLPSIVQHFVVFRLNQISRSSIRFENTPFDSSNIRVSEAALNLVNILMETWKITPDYFRSILEEAVEFHLFRSIDPTNTITDFLFGLTEGDCWQIEENINSIVTEKVIEDFFRLGEIEFDCQNEAKVTLKELEKKISKKIEKADDDNKFDSFYQSVEWLLYFASFVPNSQIFSIEMELISIMSKNRELKGFTAYLKKQKYPPEHPVTLDEFYEYLEDFRS